jgi:hypothetical protein
MGGNLWDVACGHTWSSWSVVVAPLWEPSGLRRPRQLICREQQTWDRVPCHKLLATHEALAGGEQAVVWRRVT